ncbi:hybrid sensor histidine kinase/response regulator transcription factor [Flammeovirga pacifica]|nr:hybrid sensor histidine kinase/response regulator transcription factor [Flammeovirga pacifica]
MKWTFNQYFRTPINVIRLLTLSPSVKLWFYLLISINISISFAKIKQVKEYEINKVSNISQLDVRDVFKDSKGFLWLATSDGLVRYNGLDSKVYRVSSSANSISSNMIRKISEDQLGNIWVSTFGKGLSRLDVKTETFTNYSIKSDQHYQLKTNDISSFLIDENTIWVGNWDQLIRVDLDVNNDKIIRQSSINLMDIDTSLHQVVVQTIFKGKDNHIWLGLNSSLVRINTTNKALDQINFDKIEGNVAALHYCDERLITSGEFVSSLEGQQNNLYLKELNYQSANTIAYKDGILWLGNRKGVFAYHLSQNGLQLIKFYQATSNSGRSYHPVTSIILDNDKVWVATTGGGVYLIEQPNHLFEHYQQTENNSLYDDHVKAIFEDSQQNLWVGTELGGLNYLIKENKYNYDNGFGQLSIKNYPSENNRVYAIAEQHFPHSALRDRLIWLGTTFPTFLIALDPSTMQLLPQSPIAKKLGFVFDIEVQNDSTLWIGTYNDGLWRIRVDKDGSILSAQNFDKNNGSLTSDIIRSILLDSHQNLWVGTDKGLNLIKSTELEKTHPKVITFREGKSKKSLPNEYILKIFESHDGTIWMGSMGGGLIYCQPSEQPVFKSITVEHGLANNSIKSIEEDAEHNLWLSSNLGLTKFNPSTSQCVNYTTSDGLQANEFEDLVSYTRKSGQILFGGVNGINTFYPNQIHLDSVPPNLYFSELQILNEVIYPHKKYEGKTILENSIEHTQKIILGHDQNSFSIAFEAFQFNYPDKVKFKYKLEGFDKKWTSTRHNNQQAKYTNLPAGDYILKVNAANSDNFWSDQPKELKITIQRHPFLSNYAIVIYVLSTFLLLIIIYRIYSRIRKQKKEVFIAGLEKKNAEEAAQSKLRFFTNISHEFRTPLTLITIPLDRLINSIDLSEVEKKKHLKIIKQNADLMLRLVNQILDFRKLEQNKMQLSMQSMNIIEFISSIVKGFQPLADNKEITLQFKSKSQALNMSFDPDCVEKIVNNLISNALKFTSKKGTVLMEIEEIDQKVLIKVTDNGIGIKESDKPFLFQRYFQRSDKSKMLRNGTGIGLSLIKNLVDLHQGVIEVESKEGEGSVFKVFLPMVHHEVGEVIPQDKIYEETYTNEDIINRVGNTFSLQQKKYSLLIVEDNEELRALIVSLFDQMYHVLEAEDGEQGYQKCIQHQPDIIISDVMMPKMNGLDMLHKIKSDDIVNHIPIILLTAKSTNENQIEGLMEGADAYVSKPFDQNVLSSIVFSILKNRERLIEKFDKEIKINPSLISTQKPDVQFIEKVLKIIEENLDNSDFNVDQLANDYGLSRNHLNKKLKALTGETALSFIRNVRLKHAAELFKQGNTNISEVTWKVGYSDLATFRKRFKEKFGVSPSDYVNNTIQYNE